MAPPDAEASPTGLPTLDEVQYAVAVAAARTPADLRLSGARVLDPFTGGLRPADVLLAGRLIAAVVPVGGDPNGEAPGGRDPERVRPDAARTVELDGGVLSPGLLDGHMHLESSLVGPASYAEAVLPRGVTGVVCDPHEVANVAGEAGVRWLLARAAGLPFDVWVTVPSCVPSTALETAGAALGPDAIERLMALPNAVGLAELMSFPQVIAGDAEVLAKAVAAERWGGTIEGHGPGLGGARLQAYLASGVGSEHEAANPDEAMEKLRAGVFLWVREGSVARDARALAPLVRTSHRGRFGFCTDDQLPHDLLREGGVDHALRTVCGVGADPIEALIGGTWSAARHYRLPRRGAVAPGMLADLVHWRGELAAFDADRVWKEGRTVARGGRPTGSLQEASPARNDASLARSVSLPSDVADRLDQALRFKGDADPAAPAPVIGVRPGSLLTDAEEAVPGAENDRLASDPDRDLALLVCAERHGVHGRVAATQVRGFGLRRGALAASVGHDHHNLMAVGIEPAQVVAALRRLARSGGGLVVVDGDATVAELPLPLGGLLSDAPLHEVRDALDGLDAAAAALGCTLEAPLMALSFLGLAVIPARKLTDHGLVDVNEGRLVPQPWGVA
ncbi:MAG: adenine deaminase C-terminal domain-containing protein [Trueperaceae bacterium]|nr:adenine deaminase C-terminal domain-containing protein [Trueperaceae bacterium]